MHPIHRFVRHRPRLVIAIFIGAIVGLLLPERWGLVTRLLTAWNAGVWIYLFSVAQLILHADCHRVRLIAEREDNSAVAVLTTLSVAAVISIVAIVLELATSKDLPTSQRLWHFAFTGGTVLGSWLLVGILFTFHYASMFYMMPTDKRPLAFPRQEDNPDYWDFLYFSFTIAVAAQTSDVTILSRPMRQVVLAQSVLSFLFNAAIIGLSVNIAASLVG